MVKKEKFEFASADKKSVIRGQEWIPENGEIKAVLQITHGMVEYIQRYDAFANFLCERGFAVVGHDHIGHGDSVENESQWGIMDAEHPSDVMVEDMYTDFVMHKEKFPNVPYFMLGHSMGSYMLRKYISVHAKDMTGVNGVIIMGTGTEADGAIKAGKLVLGIISKFKGWDYRSSFVEGLMYGAPYKIYDVTGAVPEKSWLSKNLDSVKAYYKDPKCTYKFSLSGYKALLEATGFDNKQENINKVSKDIPVIFVSGADDPVGNMGKGVQAAFDKFQTAGIKDVSMKLYENDRHEILNELDRENIYEDLYQWMKERM